MSIAARLKKIEGALSAYKDMQQKNCNAEQLKSSLIEHTKYFYKLRTHREFHIRPGQNRQPVAMVFADAIEKAFRGDPKYKRLIFQCPPRYGKTELCIGAVSWGYALYPDSNFIYTSYNKEISTKSTKTIKRTLELREYQSMYGIELMGDSKASDNFETNHGGSCVGVGALGSLTGRGAGVPDVDRFGGAIIIDDIHKPSDIHSDKYRDSVKNWWFETLLSRVNSEKTPIIVIGQSLHEDDLIENLKNGLDGENWKVITLPALDSINNALMPDMHTAEKLLKMKETNPYVFSAQYQQEPIPAGGGLYKKDWFYPLLDDIPDIMHTFITCDTAETDKTYNDATVFSFWGIYKQKIGDIQTDQLALHWLDCVELRIEPKDLQNELMSFYADCMRFHVKPSAIAIEKKSTGVTLASNLQTIPGLKIIEIQRTRAGGSKSTRFIEMQPYIASKRISLHKNANHNSICIDHMCKITANDTHRHDDIADTCYDAVKLALIDQGLNALYMPVEDNSNLHKAFRQTKNTGYKTWTK